MFWICTGNVDNTDDLVTAEQHQGIFCFSHHPTSELAGGAQEAGRVHSQDS